MLQEQQCGSILLTPAAVHLTPNLAPKCFDLSGVALRDATSGQVFVDLRRGLLVGTLFTLVLAGMSLLAVVPSITAGVGLALLVFRMMELRVMVDWSSIGIMSATAAVVSLLITVLTLPTLRSATRLAALRTE